jgi:hypothetical protein
MPPIPPRPSIQRVKLAPLPIGARVDIPKRIQDCWKELIALVKEGVSGDVVSIGQLGAGNKFESNKGKFKRLATMALKEVIRQLDTEGKVSFNSGGPAVSGEAYLKTNDGLEVMICPDSKDLGVMYRINSGPNNWLPWATNDSRTLWRPCLSSEGDNASKLASVVIAIMKLKSRLKMI